MSSLEEFGELSSDVEFINAVRNFEDHLEKVDKSLEIATNFANYEKLSTAEKVKFDNYLAYTINSLFWMKVKLNGYDANEHGVKNELNRVRTTMQRETQIIESNTIRPVIDKGAANRFVRRGLQIPREKTSKEDSVEAQNE